MLSRITSKAFKCLQEDFSSLEVVILIRCLRLCTSAARCSWTNLTVYCCLRIRWSILGMAIQLAPYLRSLSSSLVQGRNKIKLMWEQNAIMLILMCGSIFLISRKADIIMLLVRSLTDSFMCSVEFLTNPKSTLTLSKSSTMWPKEIGNSFNSLLISSKLDKV